MIDRLTVQTLTTKLDLGHTTAKEAKDHLKKYCHLIVKGRSREDVIRAMNHELRAAEAGTSNQGDLLS